MTDVKPQKPTMYVLAGYDPKGTFAKELDSVVTSY